MIIIALLFSLLLIIIDQILKFFVMNNIPLNHSIDVIKFGDLKLFNLTNILNDGAGRITSYNVCYTKLLRDPPFDHQADGGGGDLEERLHRGRLPLDGDARL